MQPDLPVEVPGSYYLREQDILMLRFVQGEPQLTSGVETEGSKAVLDDLGGVLAYSRNKVSRALHAIAIGPASKLVPRDALRGPTRRDLLIEPVPGEAGTYLVPLFPGAGNVGRIRYEVEGLDDGHAPLALLLASSKRMVALVVPAARDRLPGILFPPA